MAFTTLNLGLTLTIPTSGTRNWGPTLLATTWSKISQHSHTGGGDGNQIPSSGIADGAITTAKLGDNLGLTVAATLTPVGTTETIDFDDGNIQVLDLGSASGDVTLTLSNPVSGGLYYIYIIQGATPRDIIWPASVRWPQAQKILLTQTDDATDLVILNYVGTTYRGVWELDFA